MPLAAPAPWALVVAIRALITLPAPLSEAVTVSHHTRNISLLSIKQVPGPTPQYVEYGPPEFTTFDNETDACLACVEYFPEKQDGKKHHSSLYKDREGGVWERACRAGKCDFRDPQTQPVGGVAGRGVGPGGRPDGKTCITRDPVQWYADCEPVVLKAATELTEVTRACSYKHQIFVPPPHGSVSRIAGSKGNAWRRIGGNEEQCLATIEKQGAAMFDTMSFCDSNLKALSGCCETIFSALNCVAETSVKKGLWDPKNETSVLAALDHEGSHIVESFKKFCVPLCHNKQDGFCKKHPSSDPCVKFNACADCTAKGGLWCPKLKSCHCPSKDPPCIKPPIMTPLECLEYDKKRFRPIKVLKDDKDNVTKNDGLDELEDAAEAICPYSTFASEWSD